MPSQKAQKIDFNAEYPCPCRRRGRLVPIALTEAFGCDRCQHIFVVEESGHAIEQLPTNYPYKRSWRWNGHHWSIAHPGIRENYFPLVVLIMAGLLIMWLFLAQRSLPALMSVILPVLVAVLVVLVLWLAYRR